MEYSDDFYNFYLFFQKAKENEAMTFDWERVGLVKRGLVDRGAWVSGKPQF